MNKPEVLQCIRQTVKEKIARLERLIAETRAANNETKSSMGDKYETSREMVQQEINNLQLQLNDHLKSQQLLQKLNTDQHTKVGLGSLFQTEGGYFYLAVSLGEICVHNDKIFAISPESPLGTAVFGKKELAPFTLNDTSLTILKIW